MSFLNDSRADWQAVYKPGVRSAGTARPAEGPSVARERDIVRGEARLAMVRHAVEASCKARQLVATGKLAFELQQRRRFACSRRDIDRCSTNDGCGTADVAYEGGRVAFTVLI